MLKAVDENVWVAEQPIRYFGLGIRTRMTVVRLANRELVVISPIRMDDELANQLGALGAIAPNLYHYFFAAECKVRYPKAIFWAAPGLAAKKPDLPIDQTITTQEKWPLNELKFAHFDGFKSLSFSGADSLNECVFFHQQSRTLILTDTAFNFDESFPLVIQLVTRVGGGYKSLSPSLLEQIATTDKPKVKAAVEQVLAWDFERVIMAHGAI
ncbi:MAG: hypothetical protein DCF25_17695 [Leptolyngbya foveolarum]|uniref:DUF4336 domain-containing protein n=1 Tax=Leptolyngbya foveolarum TaxID=47253 RepID=A0A2W4U5F9_9CYAN|nr:MAG: hypothetical protein DCF25_17695 [Leptolyngbya foveolarum]